MSGKSANPESSDPLIISRELNAIEIQLAILAQLKKISFLLENISGVDVEAEVFNGRI